MHVFDPARLRAVDSSHVDTGTGEAALTRVAALPFTGVEDLRHCQHNSGPPNDILGQ